MPLSEHEQKMLDQMEQALYAEDPRFASHMKGGAAGRASRRRVVLGTGTALTGLVLVVAGVALGVVALGVLGFVLMVAGVAWAVTPVRRAGELRSVQGGTTRRTGRRRAAATRAPASGTFVQRMEQRWEKRRREGQGW